MLAFLPAQIVGLISLSLYVLNLFIVALLAIIVAIPMYLIPVKKWRQPFARFIHETIPYLWATNSYCIMKLTTNITWDIQGTGDLHKQGWYLLICNHQSWLDIIVLEEVFAKKIPMLKFFMKKELLWTLPVAGVACWLIGFPFMKRYSKEYLKKHPEKAGKDLEITRKACAKFKDQPITIVNYIEGTRFTQEKHDRQQSPYKHLLKPKAGGFSFILEAMEGNLDYIINTTIIYPQSKMNLWRFMCGKVKKIIVRYETLSVTPDLIGEYFNNPEFRHHFQQWTNQLWRGKDELIESILQHEKIYTTHRNP